MKLKIESMNEYSEAKIYKSKPELRNSNVNADYFYSSAEIFESVASCTEFVYDKPQINRHVSANASWYLSFQHGILDVTQICFRKLAFMLKNCQYLWLTKLEPSRNVSTIKQGNQNTGEPLLSGLLLSGRLLFGCQRPKSRKKLSANKNLYSTTTSIKWARSASCRPKGDFVLFYTANKRPVVSSPRVAAF